MANEIRVWQIEGTHLVPLESTMAQAGRTEQDLQEWIRANPEILGQDVVVVGEKVRIDGMEIDFVGVDRSGNVVIIELKRDRPPRDVLAQAIDYASAAAAWDLDKLEAIFEKFRPNQQWDTYINERMRDLDIVEDRWNASQRILLVSTSSVEEPLQRMMDWLSGNYQVDINAVLLRYVRTKDNAEFIARTTTIPEDVAKGRSQRQQRRIATSPDPGAYSDEELRGHLKEYLLQTRGVPRWMRHIILPLCLREGTVTRDRIIKELVARKEADSEGTAGRRLSTISRELVIARHDYLRQIVSYESPGDRPWEKDNYRIRDGYADTVNQVLDELTAGDKR